MNDPTWKSMHEHEDIPYKVENIRKRILTSWSRTAVQHNANNQDLGDTTTAEIAQGYLHCDRLTALRNLSIRYPMLPEDNFVNLGEQRAEQDAEFRKMYKNGQLKRASSKAGPKTVGALSSSDHGKAGNATKKAADTMVLEEMRKDLIDTLSRLDGLAAEDVLGDMTAANAGPSPELLRSSLLAGTRVGSSGSSKLNYLLSEVSVLSIA